MLRYKHENFILNRVNKKFLRIQIANGYFVYTIPVGEEKKNRNTIDCGLTRLQLQASRETNITYTTACFPLHLF